jgi:hypothetical protein
MEKREQRRGAAGQHLRRASVVTGEQTFVGWAAVIIGGLFMAAGGVVMILSLS